MQLGSVPVRSRMRTSSHAAVLSHRAIWLSALILVARGLRNAHCFVVYVSLRCQHRWGNVASKTHLEDEIRNEPSLPAVPTIIIDIVHAHTYYASAICRTQRVSTSQGGQFHIAPLSEDRRLSLVPAFTHSLGHWQHRYRQSVTL